jgi:hypothetical protein
LPRRLRPERPRVREAERREERANRSGRRYRKEAGLVLSILGRLLDAIDYQDFDRSPRGLELQSELLFERREQ